MSVKDISLSLYLVYNLKICDQVEVIVNSTSANFDLMSGTLSSAIARTGGPSLQAEVNLYVPNGVLPGEIIVTNGGTLMCYHVYHVRLEDWDDTNDKAQKVINSLG